MTAQTSIAVLIFILGTYLLATGVRDDGPAADLVVLVGAAVFAAGLFLFGFTIKRFLFVRRVRLHVKDKKATGFHNF